VQFPLQPDHVLLRRDFASKEEVVEAIGSLMVHAGDVGPPYARGLIEKEQQYSTWVTDGVALPHGTNAVKDHVLRNALVVVQLPRGVDWGGGKTVYIAIGLAGRGDDQHIALLSALAGVLQEPGNIRRLRSASTETEVISILAAGSGEEEAS
jgi:mannitol/fructose-specific phosphotransferase system IIA component